MYLVFDTETTGLPKNWNAPVTDLPNWPRVIQLGWGLFDENYTLIDSAIDLIKPDGWVMPTEEFWTLHGYTQDFSMQYGQPILSTLIKFNGALARSKYLIAHNMSFDQKVLGAEFLRANIKGTNRPIKLCTKELSTSFCQLPGKKGYFKWPTLTELHVKLFNEPFIGAHDAMNDVIACGKCFFKLKELQVIKL